MKRDIEIICKEKEQELLEKYFGNFGKEAAGECDESIDAYPKELPLRIEAEFRDYIAELWKEYSDTPLVLEEQKLRQMMTEDDVEGIEDAYKKAERITLWERITGSNCEDVAHYKGLLYEYTRDLLTVMRIDFLEEITGRHINCKAFEE